jgi:uncharacterized membrane protein YuzA (DUF378 family)
MNKRGMEEGGPSEAVKNLVYMVIGIAVLVFLILIFRKFF